jgi:hypothetical protein
MTQHRLVGLRGKPYIIRSKQIMAKEGENIAATFAAVIQEKGKFTPLDLGALAVEFRLPITLLDDYLPTLTKGRYATGTWERLRDRGCTAKMIGVIWSDRDG